MSDDSPAYPPPPPSGVTPPPPPVYQGPPPPDYIQPYMQQQPPPYPPPAYGPPAGVGGVTGLIAQFSGRAGWSCGIGLVTIVAPFLVHFVFYILSLVGLLYGIQAIRRGQLIGGIVGIALNIIGGLLTIFLLTAG